MIVFEGDARATHCPLEVDVAEAQGATFDRHCRRTGAAHGRPFAPTAGTVLEVRLLVVRDRQVDGIFIDRWH
jgi:hypothetical protein